MVRIEDEGWDLEVEARLGSGKGGGRQGEVEHQNEKHNGARSPVRLFWKGEG